MFDRGMPTGVAPCIQLMQDGRCLLTFDSARGMVLPSLEYAIRWCSEHLEDGTPPVKAQKQVELLLRRGDVFQADLELQAEVLLALLDAWSYAVRCNQPANCDNRDLYLN